MFRLHHKTANPFNQHITRLTEILAGGSHKVQLVDHLAGAHAACDNTKKIIYLPRLNMADLNETEARKVFAYAAHERKHAQLSSAEVSVKRAKIIEESESSRELFHTLAQIIEDCRIETNTEYSLPGDMSDLNFVRNIFIEEINSKKDQYIANNPLAWLIYCFQYRILAAHPSFHFNVELEIPEELRELFDLAWNILNDGRFAESCKVGREKHQTTLDLALEIEKAWEEKKDSFEKEEKDDINKIFGKMQEGDSKIEDQPIMQIVQDIIDEKNPEMSDDDSDGDSGSGGKRPDNAGDYEGYNLYDQIIEARPNQESYEKTRENLTHSIMATKNALSVYLKSVSQSKTRHKLKNGNLDVRRLHRTARGLNCKRVFKKTTPGIDMSTAVSIVVDLSSSMNLRDENNLAAYEVARQMAILFAEVFHLLDIPFEVLGFNTGRIPNYPFDYKPVDINMEETREEVNHWIFKSFDQRYFDGETRYRLGEIEGNGCNVDHETIQWAAARLWERPENRKLMIVLSDGYPSGHSGHYKGALKDRLSEINARILASGMEQFALGIKSDAVSNYYKNYSVINNVDEFNSEALRMLANYLTKGQCSLRI